MRVPVSWLKEFIDIHLPLEELAHRLTMAGMEVEEICLVGLPMPPGEKHEFKITGLSWDPDKIVVGAIHEVMPHPNADRLVLCRLDDGEREHIVLTGAPNLFAYKGQGPLPQPLKVAYAREGARVYDGHEAEQKLMTIKRTKIRGVESSSMACSEKELGISSDHEGIIILDDDAPVGVALAEYMGDAVFDIAITPNIARNANILGIAREIAALTGQELRPLNLDILAEGPSIAGQISVDIQCPELNPRFLLGLVRDVTIRPSPYWVQHRLRLAGMRPINNIVDATNYVMWEIGQPLHAFDYDVLLERAGDGPLKIITRTAHPNERLTTLDGEERELDDFTVLVCDTAGSLSIAGVMGGVESEVNEQTRNVLLEGAAWNFINIRRTVAAQRLPSEAAYRFSRGVHPAQAERGVRRALELMRQWSGGTVDRDLVDNYPCPPEDPIVDITAGDVQRLLGITLTLEEITDILTPLGFTCVREGETLRIQTPDHRLDIGEGIVGKADLLEEIARIYGYDQIPETRLADELPPQRDNPLWDGEERLRDILVKLGLQEVITYRLTSPEREARLLPPDTPHEDLIYTRLENPPTAERTVMRRSLLGSVLEIIERNARLRERLALFEIGPIYLPQEGELLPDEPTRMVIVLTGLRYLPMWDHQSSEVLDFYDLKGIIEALLGELHLDGAQYEPTEHLTFHPGKTAQVRMGKRVLGIFGEVHPQVHEQYDFPDTPVLAAEFDVETLLTLVPDRHDMRPVPIFPPVLEDLAIVVDEALPAARVVEVIQKAGGKMIADARLFDMYRGEQIGSGKKSLAYSLTYQAPDRTLTDKEVARIRGRIIQRLERELGAKLRS